MSKKVCVLISTYNGEKYLKTQLDSILNQTYKNIEIVIRDDGSKDSTIDIIKEYQKNNSNIILHEGTNIGFIHSFFRLLEISDGDYYAYCDQDDFWMENKIELAVNELDKVDDSKPNMVFGNSDYYNENMEFIGKGEEHRWFDFKNSLYECVAQGMTMTINNTAKQIIVDNIPESCLFHDWWTYMICSGMGNILYNDVTTVKYRRFEKNATAEGQGFLKIFLWRVKKIFMDSGIKDIKIQQKEFKKMFYENLPDENKKILNIFVNEKYSIIKAFQKMFYPKRLRRKIIDDIAIRILFLFGVL